MTIQLNKTNFKDITENVQSFKTTKVEIETKEPLKQFPTFPSLHENCI